MVTDLQSIRGVSADRIFIGVKGFEATFACKTENGVGAAFHSMDPVGTLFNCMACATATNQT